ncbi:MAG: heme b synthase [Actinobacteria bacterium]|nr:heme b synthase [Actinomycetota bacterium]
MDGLSRFEEVFVHTAEGSKLAPGAVLPPRMIAWEITRSCNLACIHCRASALHGPYEGELSTEEAKALLDNIKSFSSPIIILTGGEPLARPDFHDIAKYGADIGLRMVLGTNATLMTPEIAAGVKEVGIPRMSVSIDFPVPEKHDEFRGLPGAFEAAVKGIKTAQEAGIEVQINSTITKLNVAYLDGLLEFAKGVGAVAFHPFLLVPTGRGKELEEQELPPEEYERTLNWVYDKQKEEKGIFFKPTDAPHYFRIMRQRAKAEGEKASKMMSGHPHASRGLETMTRGCLGGIGFCFISHVGQVQPCGYFEKAAGNIKEQTFKEVWENSPLFADLRDYDKLKGKCGACEFKRVCGGCRARAYEVTGDYLAEEPYCVYEPKRAKVPMCQSTNVDGIAEV